MVNISRTQVNPKEHNFKTAHQYTPEIELLKKETHTNCKQCETYSDWRRLSC